MIKFIDEEAIVSAMFKRFKKEHGNLSIPVDFTTKDGYTFDKDGYNLFKKLKEYQDAYDEDVLSNDKKKELNKLGYNFKKTYKEVIWNQFYNLAKNYYEAYFNLNIPFNFKTKDGVKENKEGYDLGKWFDEQVLAFYSNQLTKDQICDLNEIGFFDIFSQEKITVSWLRNWNLIKMYYKNHGNFNIPEGFKTFDGITQNPNGFNIHAWLMSQIDKYNKNLLSNVKVTLLQHINFNFEEFRFLTVSGKKWMKKYNMCKNYSENYGDLNLMPCNFRTLDGINEDEKGINLSSWLYYQYVLHQQGKLEPVKIKLLEEIGYDVNLTKDDIYWEDNYFLAENFYNKYGHSDIPRDYITKNGITYHDEGYHIGDWFYDQLVRFREGSLLPERYIKLSRLNPVWWIKTEETRIDSVCDFYGINTELNFDVLNRINYYELNAKINFLLSNNLPLTTNGKLHEIFSMCSANMEQNYNISYEDIIKNYYNKELILERTSN